MAESELQKPRGRMTPFAAYVLICMEQARKEYPDKTLVLKKFETVCLRRWDKMTDFKKKRFIQMSETDGSRFDLEMKEYKEKKEAMIKEKKEKKKEEVKEKKSQLNKEKQEELERKKIAKKEELERKKSEKKEELERKKNEKKAELEKKKAEKKKKKKDPNAPKGAKSSYMCFSQEIRAKLLAENPSISVPEVGKECGKRWKELSPSQKAKYEKMANQDKERFKTEMAEYEAEKEAEGAFNQPGPSGSEEKRSEEESESGESEESEEESE